MRRISTLFYFFGNFMGFTLLALLLNLCIDNFLKLINFQNNLLVIYIHISLWVIAILLSFICTNYQRKKESEELSEQLGRQYEKTKYIDKYYCIIGFINSRTTAASYTTIRNTIIAELKSKMAVINVTTLVGVVISIFIDMFSKHTPLLYILLIAISVTTYAYIYYLREYAYIQSILESLPDNYVNFVEKYVRNTTFNQESVSVKKVTEPHVNSDSTAAVFTVTISSCDDDFAKEYSIKIKKTE